MAITQKSASLIFPDNITSESGIDISKLLTYTDFPIFVLNPHTLSFRFHGINVSAHGYDEESYVINGTSLIYTYPGVIEYERVILVDTLNEEVNPIDEQERFLLSSIVTGITHLVQAGYCPALTLDEFTQNYYEIWEAGMKAWGTQPAFLPFKRFYLDEPFPLHLAHATIGKVIVGVGAFGVSQSDFETILDSIMPLEEESEFVEVLQKEKDAAGRERMEWGKSQRGLSD